MAFGVAAGRPWPGPARFALFAQILSLLPHTLQLPIMPLYNAFPGSSTSPPASQKTKKIRSSLNLVNLPSLGAADNAKSLC